MPTIITVIAKGSIVVIIVTIMFVLLLREVLLLLLILLLLLYLILLYLDFTKKRVCWRFRAAVYLKSALLATICLDIRRSVC